MEISKLTTIQWRKFLSTGAGQEGLSWLREETPRIPKGLPHEIQFDAGYNQGYVKCLERILELLTLNEPRDVRIDNNNSLTD